VRWIVDGNNVMGARPDGWWNDRPAAMERLTQEIALWCRTHADQVILVFDGPSLRRVSILAGGNLQIRFAGRNVRDAADDAIVVRAMEAEPPLTVVTADRGLRRRLPTSAGVEGPGTFLTRVAAAAP
jgi:hypothetical protein